MTLWERDRGRFGRNLIREKSSEAFLKRVEKGLKGGLNDLAHAARVGAIRIEGDRFSVPREDPQELDPEVIETRRRLIAAIGDQQLPHVIVGIDHATRFSTKLLGRSPGSEREQVVLYELRPCSRTLGYFTPVHERGTEWGYDGTTRMSSRQQRLTGSTSLEQRKAA